MKRIYLLMLVSFFFTNCIAQATEDKMLLSDVAIQLLQLKTYAATHFDSIKLPKEYGKYPSSFKFLDYGNSEIFFSDYGNEICHSYIARRENRDSTEQAQNLVKLADCITQSGIAGEPFFVDEAYRYMWEIKVGDRNYTITIGQGLNGRGEYKTSMSFSENHKYFKGTYETRNQYKKNNKPAVVPAKPKESEESKYAYEDVSRFKLLMDGLTNEINDVTKKIKDIRAAAKKSNSGFYVENETRAVLVTINKLITKSEDLKKEYDGKVEPGKITQLANVIEDLKDMASSN